MMRNATRNDFDAISALIFNGDIHIGSACLLWSEDKENLYCITADHCTRHKNGTDYDVHIKYHDNGELKDYKIIGNKMCDQVNDVAIYELEQSDDAKATIPYTLTSNLLVPPKACYISGYPQKDQKTRRTIHAEFIPMNTDKIIYLNLPDLDVDSINRYDEIVGISGGGCYEVIENGIKFIGIENKALDKDVPFREVHCVPLPRINQLLISKEKSELPKPTPSYITERLGKYSTASEILSNQSFNNTWVDLSISEDVKKKIHNHFTSSKDKTSLFICGLSGVGKTRSVLNACKANGFENTIYYKNYYSFSNDMIELRNYSTNNIETFNIIIDEATLENWHEVNNSFYEYSDYFRIVLIGTVPKNQDLRDENTFQLSLNPEKDTIKVIEAEHPSFTQEEMQSIYKLSRNDLRLTILISRLYENEKKRNISKDASIINRPAVFLRDTFSSAEDILKRTIELNKNAAPHGVDIAGYFNKLSLFVDIGFQNRVTTEIDSLAEYFHDNNSSKFKLAIDYLNNIDLGIKKEDYFEPSPRALAKLAFEQQGWKLIQYDLENFMKRIPTEIMRIRFFDRLVECGLKEVEEALASWFRQKYQISDLKVLGCNAKEVSLYIEHYPEIGLPWLKNTILNSSDEELKQFGNILMPGRRNVVWTCEHLANFKEYFFDCEQILFKLAENECEPVIANNSQGIWSSYFSIMHANTEIPFYERYDVLIKRAVECVNENDVDLFIKAFSTVFVDGNIRWVPPEMIGGMITPPNWEPKTLGDIIEAKRYALNKLVESFDSFKGFIQVIIIDVISGNMWSFISYNMLLDYKNAVNHMLKSQAQKNALILNIERQISMLVYHKSKNETMAFRNIGILKQWIEELRDVTLIGRLDEYLNRSIWSYGHSNEEKQKTEELISGIAEGFYHLPDKLLTIRKIIEEANYDKDAMSSFAEHLAIFDDTFDLFEIISYISNKKLDNSFLQGYYVGFYKKNNALPEKLINVLDEIVKVNADFALWASVAFDVSNNGYNRILSMLDSSNSIHCVANIKYKEWTSFLSIERKVKLCNTLSNCESDIKYIICFELLHGWVQQGEISSKIHELCIRLFKKCLEDKSRFEIYIIVELYKKISKEYQNEAVRLMITLFDFNNSYRSDNYYIYDFIVSIKNPDNEKIIMKYLGERLIISAKSFKSEALHGFFDNFSLSVIKEWIDENPNERAPLIAYHLASPNLENKEFSELALYVLSVFGNDDTVYNSFILGGYNLVVYEPENYYNKKEEWYEMLKFHETSPIAFIRQWAKYKKKRIEGICDDHRKDQAEDARYKKI